MCFASSVRLVVQETHPGISITLVEMQKKADADAEEK